MNRDDRDELAQTIRAGFYGSADQAGEAERALTRLISYLDEDAAAIDHWRARYGEAIADPLTELRLRLQRGQ